MCILEIVFNSRKFDLNDDVLMGFDNYFDKKSKDYHVAVYVRHLAGTAHIHCVGELVLELLSFWM